MQLQDRIDKFHDILTDGVFTNKTGEFIETKEAIKHIRYLLTSSKHIYIVGNGGSAAIASHAVIDFCNVGGLPTFTLHDPATITCIGNDYGYQHIYAKQLEKIVTSKDTLIAISSSGKSDNIINAARVMKNAKANVITLSGFEHDNVLRNLGNVNYWLNSKDYGMVEVGHSFLLHYLADCVKL